MRLTSRRAAMGLLSLVMLTMAQSVIGATATDFTISVFPSLLVISQGSSGTATVTLSSPPFLSNASTITLTGSGAPSGVVISFSPNPLGIPAYDFVSFASNASMVAATVDRNVLVGNYSITIVATSSQGIIHSAQMTLRVKVQGPDFVMSVFPPIARVAAGGGPVNYTVTIKSSSGFTGPVRLELPLPSPVVGSSWQFTTESVTLSPNGASNSTLRVWVSTTTFVGRHNLTITASSRTPPILHTVQVQLIVSVNMLQPPDFALSLSPDKLTVSQGSSGNSTVAMHDTSHAKAVVAARSAISLTASGNPTGVGVTFRSNSLTQNSPSTTVTINVAGNVTAGTYPIRITGQAIAGGCIGGFCYDYFLSRNATMMLTVAPRCFISTAAYGSELAPEVQFLRDFRDNSVLKTKAGSNFMIAFNAWYYSFSPGIAAWIAGSETARSFTRAVLYPLIGALTISSSIFDLFSFNTEIAALVAGISASSLLGAIYLTLPIIIVTRVAKRRMDRKALTSILGIGLALALFGTLSNGTLGLAQILTSVVVLETMLLAPSILAQGILGKACRSRVGIKRQS